MLQRSFHDFGPQHIYEYACGTKSFQLRVSLWFYLPRDDTYCKIWVKSPVWNRIDLTFGLLMVGVFEELVFRGYLHTFIRRYTKNPLLPVVASAIAFGLIHWSGGLHGILITGAIGAIFMIAYRSSGPFLRSCWPIL